MIAFVLGAIITYLFMRLEMAKEELRVMLLSHELEAENRFLKMQLNPEANEKDKKHWFDERMEQEAAATAQKIKEQESQGDALKNQFEKFIKWWMRWNC